MKKEKQEIATNTSSGAEKVETIEREIKQDGGVKNTKARKTVSAKGEAALGSEGKKTAKTKTENKTEKERKAAKDRVEAALKKKEAKEKKRAERKAKFEKKKAELKKRIEEQKAKLAKRKAEKKARAEKHAAERKALAEKRAAEKEEKLRERARKKADKHRAHSRKKAEKRQARKGGNEERKHRNQGYGGWIAAVVSLGVVTLALATTVTVGAIEVRRATNAAISGYRATMYELTGIMENVDNDLDRARISATSAQQSRVLTDLLVQTRLAELDIEKLPLEAEADRNVTIFVNRTAKECERMLSKLNNGELLDGRDYAILEKLYETNHAVRMELNKLTNEMTDKDFMSFMKKGQGMMKDVFDRIEKATIGENKLGDKGKTDGAGTRQTAKMPSDKPECKIEPTRAEALCEKYFSAYNIKEFQCVGETVGKAYSAYNVQGYDEKGSMLFAEVSQQDGALLRFDYYEECSTETFDMPNAERIAEEFLEKLGYDDMEVARYRQNGSTTDFTFVYEDDDVFYYPDEIRVKVCRTRGVVSGMDATKYIARHKDREEPSIRLTLAQAKDALHEKLSVESARLTVVDTVRGERAAYEFLCSYGEDDYFVFVDANNGNEIAIVNTKNV